MFEQSFSLSKAADLAPPTTNLTIHSTWDEVLIRLFPGSSPITNINELTTLLVGFLAFKTKQQFPEGEAWVEKAWEGNFEGYDAFRDSIRVQLQGLGLIDVRQAGHGGEAWVLTPKGKIRCALVVGHRRTEAHSD